jgi:hypothetical protein
LWLLEGKRSILRRNDVSGLLGEQLPLVDLRFSYRVIDKKFSQEGPLLLHVTPGLSLIVSVIGISQPLAPVESLLLGDSELLQEPLGVVKGVQRNIETRLQCGQLSLE